MTILNMTGGGKSVKVPLNDISTLSATAGDTEATITWTDVGNLTVNGVLLNTWNATKLVRKVGSAPSDSSDGTLVLTETVADTYSSTGYTDTGLTNGTTYYYKAFSVGSNGLESGSNSADVTPAQGGWQPGANTIAYYPLDSVNTVNDLSGNNRTLTNYASVSFGTQGGVDCATFNGNNYLEIGSQTLNLTEFTMSCWIRWTSSSTRGFLGMGKFNTSYQCMAMLREADGKFLIAPYGDAAFSLSATISDTWYNAICVYSNNTYTIYLNAEQGSSVNKGVTISGSSNVLRLGYAATGENKLYGQLSNVIFEDKARTAQEISDYYDLTKGNYGIS